MELFHPAFGYAGVVTFLEVLSRLANLYFLQIEGDVKESVMFLTPSRIEGVPFPQGGETTFNRGDVHENKKDSSFYFVTGMISLHSLKFQTFQSMLSLSSSLSLHYH